uniref:RING-type domain-containing protein n=1 Tax=viral metagenome TaxID=1070528 RepID=A0A6C0EUY0_9ZZZZ
MSEAPRRRNACSNCRDHGHTINNCTHSSVQALMQEIQCAANYSIGFDHIAYIETWLGNLNAIQLRILAYQYNITIRSPPGQNLNVLDKRLFYIARLINATYTSQPRAAVDRQHARDSLSGEQVIAILETIEIWTSRNRNMIPITPMQTIYHQGSVIRENVRSIDNRRATNQRIIDRAQAEIAIAQARINELNNTRTILLVEWNIVEENLNQYVENMNIEPRKFDIDMVEDLSDDSASASDCPICYDSHTPEKLITTNCNHKFCSPCLVRSFDVLIATSSKHPTCAMCREPISKLTFNNNSVILMEMQEKYCKQKSNEIEVEVVEVVEEVTWYIDTLPDPVLV